MTILNSRARGLVGVRADARDANAILANLQTAFDAFKAERDKEVADINAKLGDVVQTEKVDRINAEITTLQNSLDEVNAAIAANKIGGGSMVDPAKAEHASAFETFFRRGTENNLRDLEVKAALRSGSDPDGGYLVPEQVEQGITELLRTVSTLRSLATVVSVSTDKYKKFVNKQGATTGWVGETAARSETDTSQLAELTFPVHELYANPAASQSVLDDASIDIAAWLAGEVQMEFAEAEGAAFVTGNGILQPRGILSYDTVANASYAWGSVGYIASGAAADFTTANPADKFVDLVHSLRAGYRQGASWLMNDLTAAKVRKFKAGDGNFLWQPSLQVGQPSTLLGYAAFTDDNVSDVGADAFAVAFADFRRAYLIIDRIGIRVLRDPFTNKPNVHFYTTKRVGGGIQNYEAIKLMKIAAS